MTITHTWSIDSVTHDSTTKRIKEIHWRIDSADGSHKSATYGCVELSTDVPINRSAINASLAINLVKNHLGEATIQKFIERNRNRINNSKTSTLTKGIFWYGVTTQSETDATSALPESTNTTPTPDVTFVVTVAAKTEAHQSYGDGSDNGFLIDGVEGKTLSLIPGTSYRFDQSDASNVGHPLRLWVTADKNGMYLASTVVNGDPGTSNAYLQIDIPVVDPVTPLYYQCESHDYMGGTINVTIPS